MRPTEGLLLLSYTESCTLRPQVLPFLSSGKPKASFPLLFIPCLKTSVSPGGNSFQSSCTLATSHHPLLSPWCDTEPLQCKDPPPEVQSLPINLFAPPQTLLCTMYFYIALSVKIYACNLDIWEAEVGGSQIPRLQSRSLFQNNK